jgi:hypothetical protein
MENYDQLFKVANDTAAKVAGGNPSEAPKLYDFLKNSVQRAIEAANECDLLFCLMEVNSVFSAVAVQAEQARELMYKNHPFGTIGTNQIRALDDELLRAEAGVTTSLMGDLVDAFGKNCGLNRKND